MSDWLTRFEGEAVDYPEIAACPHRARVAWGWYVLSQLLSRVSDYFVVKSGYAEALAIAREFWEGGAIDPDRVGRALVHIERVFDELTEEGYLTDMIVAGLQLLHSVIDPDPDLAPHDTRDVPLCRFPIDFGVVNRPEAYTFTASATVALQSNAATSYIEVVMWDFWRQGYGVGVLDIQDLDYLDDVMFQVLGFAREAFVPLSRAADAQLPAVAATLPKLGWSAPPPPSLHTAADSISSIPVHERASR